MILLHLIEYKKARFASITISGYLVSVAEGLGAMPTLAEGMLKTLENHHTPTARVGTAPVSRTFRNRNYFVMVQAQTRLDASEFRVFHTSLRRIAAWHYNNNIINNCT